LALPDGRVFTGEGVLAGTIASEPRGTHGFGFDPIFQLSDGRRLAELSTEEKNLLSHRARALNALEVHGAFDAALSASEGRRRAQGLAPLPVASPRPAGVRHAPAPPRLAR